MTTNLRTDRKQVVTHNKHRPKKIEDMESEDKRVNQLTQIASAPADGVLPIDVPGRTATNGITVDNLAKTMPVATSERNGMMSKELINGTLLYRGDIKKEQIDKKLEAGTYYHNEKLVPGESMYGILFVVTASDLQCQIDITLGGNILFRISHGADIDNPTWDTQWKSIL